MLVRLEKGPHHGDTEAHGEKRHGEERFSMRGMGPLLLGCLSCGFSLWRFSVSLCASVVRSFFKPDEHGFSDGAESLP